MKFAAATFKDPHRGDHWAATSTDRAPGFIPITPEAEQDFHLSSPWTTKQQARAYAEQGRGQMFVVGKEEG